MKCGIVQKVLASCMESELGTLFKNIEQGGWIRNSLTKMGYPQPKTIIITNSQVAKSVTNEASKQKRSRAINMDIH